MLIVKPGHNLLPHGALGETHGAIAVVIEVLRQVAPDRLSLVARVGFDLGQVRLIDPRPALDRCAPTLGVFRAHRHGDCHEDDSAKRSGMVLIC